MRRTEAQRNFFIAARIAFDRHTLTQHLGILPSEMIIEPFTAGVTVEPGDIFLLCSDGLTDMVDDGDIKNILKTSDSIEKSAEALYGEALRNGGKDNISVLLVLSRKERFSVMRAFRK